MGWYLGQSIHQCPTPLAPMKINPTLCERPVLTPAVKKEIELS